MKPSRAVWTSSIVFCLLAWPATARRYLESFQHAASDRRVSPRAAFAEWTLASRPYELPPLRQRGDEHCPIRLGERRVEALGDLDHPASAPEAALAVRLHRRELDGPCIPR